MFRQIIVVFLIWESVSAVIYKLNETEYNEMPALYGLDDYHKCLLEPRGTYCVVDIDLSSKTDSKLMHTIQEYSAHTMKHFNHIQIHRGVCVNATCLHFLENNTEDLSKTLEACLNNSLWENYGIEAKLSKIQYCKTEGIKTEFDASDFCMIAVYILIIAFNVVGSLYDVFVCSNNGKGGNPFLLAFSLRRNWTKLTAPSGGGTEPRLERLKLFHGMRTMTMVCVIFSHTMLVIAYSYVDNPLYIETAYEDPSKQILFNGSLVTNTFFVMSSFLLAYNFEIYSEKHKITWMQWPKGVLLRWLRLTPTFALILGTISTIMRHFGDGPLWNYVVSSESLACRQYWWTHILYINNYVYNNAFCVPQTWYLAADTQLFCLGLLVCVFTRKYNTKVVVLALLFILSLIIPAAHTYFEDLDAVVIQSPEAYRNLYSNDNTFRLMYIRGHTNLSSCILGLAGGFLTYHWQKEGKTFKQYKNYRWLIWLLFPIDVGVILSGGFFYIDGWNPPISLRIIYATFYKPVFQLLVVILIISCVFKFEGLYRGILEWRGFTWSGRVSYSAFLMHTLYQRSFVGIQTTPIHLNDYYVLFFLSATVVITYASACVLWLLVEAPASGITRALFTPATNNKPDVETTKV